jgi:hypothetical protein
MKSDQGLGILFLNEYSLSGVTQTSVRQAPVITGPLYESDKAPPGMGVS